MASSNKTLTINIQTNEEPSLRGLANVRKAMAELGLEVSKFTSKLDLETTKWGTSLDIIGKSSKDVETLADVTKKAAEALGVLEKASYSLKKVTANPLKDSIETPNAKTKESLQGKIEILREQDRNIAFYLERKAAAEKLEHDNALKAIEDKKQEIAIYKLLAKEEESLRAKSLKDKSNNALAAEAIRAREHLAKQTYFDSFFRDVAKQEEMEFNSIAKLTKQFNQEQLSKENFKRNALAGFVGNDARESLSSFNYDANVASSATQNGPNHLKTKELSAARDIAEIKRNLAKEILSIEEGTKIGTIKTYKEATDKRVVLEKEAYSKILAIRASVDKLKPTEDEFNRVHSGFKNLAIRIFEVNVIWNTLNAIQNKFSQAIGSIIPVGIALDAVRATLAATVGTAYGAESAIIAIGKEAQRTGLEVGNLRTSFKLFQASTSLAGASLQDTWKMFQNINTVQTALHATTDETSHVFLAMAQIFNKNKIQSEELVKQLGNLWPGAYASFAKSYVSANGKIGISTQELARLMKAGLVDAQSHILNFTKFMADKFAPSFALASTMLNSDIGRMKGEFTLLGEAIYSVSSGPLQEIVKSITSLTHSMTEWIKEGKSFNTTLSVLGSLIKDVGFVIEASLLFKFLKYIDNIQQAEKVTSKFTGVLGFLGKGGTVGAILALAALTQAVADYIAKTHEASDATENFFEELRKKELANKNETYTFKLALDIENDPILKKAKGEIASLINQLNELKQPFTGQPFGPHGANFDDSVTPISRETALGLTKDFDKLKQYDKNLEDISDKEISSLNIRTEKLAKYKKAQIAFFEDFIAKRKESLGLEQEAKTQEGLDAYFESRHGIEPPKRLKPSDKLENDIKIYENALIRLEKTSGKNTQEWKNGTKALEEMKQAFESTKVNEPFVEHIKYLQEELTKINSRLSPIDPKDVEKVAVERFGEGSKQKAIDEDLVKKKELEDELAEYQQRQQAARAEVETKFTKEELIRKKQFIQEQISLFERQAETEKALNATSLEELEADNDKKVISISNYLKRKNELLTQSLEAEKAAKENALALNPDEASKERLKEDISKIQNKLEKVGVTIGREFNKEFVNLQNIVLKAGEEYERITGNMFEVAEAKFTRLHKQEHDLAIQNKDDPAEAVRHLAQAYLDLEPILEANFSLQESIKNTDKERSRITQTYSNQVEEINSLHQLGAISQLDAWNRLEAVRKKEIADLTEIISLEEANLALTKEKTGGVVDEAIQQNIEKNRIILEKLKAQGSEASQYIAKSLTDSFVNAFTSIGTNFTDFFTKSKDAISLQREARRQEATANNFLAIYKQEKKNLEPKTSKPISEMTSAEINANAVLKQANLDRLAQLGHLTQAENLLKQASINRNKAQIAAEQQKYSVLLNAGKTFINGIIGEIQKLIAEELRSKFLQPLLKNAISGIGGFFSGGEVASVATSSLSTSGAGSLASFLPAAANGVAFNKGNVIPFAQGGVISRPTLFPFSKGTGLMGEDGPEAIIPLVKRRNGKLGIGSSGESGVTNIFYISIEAPKGSDKTPQDYGTKVADTFIRRIANEEIFKANRVGNYNNRIHNVR